MCGKLGQEDCEFEASVDGTWRPRLQGLRTLWASLNPRLGLWSRAKAQKLGSNLEPPGAPRGLGSRVMPLPRSSPGPLSLSTDRALCSSFPSG